MTVPVAPGAPAGEAPPATPPVPPPVPVPAAPPAPVAPAATDDTVARMAKIEAERDEWRQFSRKHERTAEQLQGALDKQDALIRTLAEKAGVEIDGAPDPAKLAEQLTNAQQSAQDRARELAIFRAATGVANADKLLDSRQFMLKTAGLDPASSDFADQVKALVAATVTADPTLAATVPVVPAPTTPVPPPALPASSGADFSGAPPGDGQWTDADVAAATEEQMVKAMEAGQLRNLGFSPRRHGRNR